MDQYSTYTFPEELISPEMWTNRELFSSIFAVEVSGTGAGSGVLCMVVSKIPQDIFSRPTQLIAIKAQICNEA